VKQILAGEVRAAFSRMQRDEWITALSKAIESEENSILGAIFNAQAMLSGFGVEELEMRRHGFRLKRFQAELARIERLKKAASNLDRISMLTKKFVDSLTDAKAIEEVEKKEAAAKAAAAA
jgi:hypothetical protein